MRKRYMLGYTMLLLFLIGLLSTPVSGIAMPWGGKYKFDYSVEVGSSNTQGTFILNDETKDLKYNIVVHGNYSDWFNFSRNNFTLKPGEQGGFNITVSPPEGTEPGNYTTGIRIVGSPPSAEGFTVGAGLLLPVKIEVRNPPTMGEKISEAGKGLIDRFKELGPMGVMMVVIIILVMVVVVMGIKLRRRKER